MPYRSPLPTSSERDALRQCSLHAAARATVRGRHWRSSATPGALRDDFGADYSLAFKHVAYPAGAVPGLAAHRAAVLSDLAARAATPGYLASKKVAKTISVRAALTQSLEPAVLAFSVAPLDPDTSRASLSLDKPASPTLIVKRLNNGVEGALLTAADDEDGGGKERTLDFPRQSGTYRVIVRVGSQKYYRDYDGDVPVSALAAYAASAEATLAGTYDQGVSDGRRAFAQAIYPLGDPDGFDSEGVLAGPDWDTPATRQSFRDTIAKKNSIDASKVFLNQLVAAGAPAYNGSSQDPAYYTGLAAPYVTAVKQLGGVSAYHSVYAAYPAFAYDTSSQDGAYLDGLKAAFVGQIQSDASASGYNTAYAEVWTAANAELPALGIPEGYANWPLATPKNAGQAANLIRFAYSSGYIRSAQLVYDEGLAAGFDFRSRTTTLDPLTSGASRQQYADLRDDFRAELQAGGQAEGLKHFLEKFRLQYGYAYDHANSAGRGDLEYVAYLQAQRDPAVSLAVEEEKRAAYLDVYDAARTLFKFTASTAGLTSSQLAALKDAMFTAVYSYGIVAELQKLYDLSAGSTFFHSLTNYPAVRDASYTPRDAYRDAKALALAALEGDYYSRVYEGGVIYVYRDRMYPLAVEYGFTFDAAQQQASYYAAKEPEFIEALRQGYAGSSPVAYVDSYDPIKQEYTVQVTLSKPAKVYGWLSQSELPVTYVVASLVPSASHTLRFKAPRGLGVVQAHIEVSNG
ncbi:hypothetical protein [Calidithermus chliarophilus]|uniref:hypothetical protein n=1 Tax=Calidithermus chliarophilus TaxID=52023 RepID=UPI000421198A|nr:hypothetical protein [Calidithermus chliarophilus]